jgi:hypothetical protein
MRMSDSRFVRHGSIPDAPDGQAVFMALAHLPGLKPDRNDELVVFHSSDGGVTWNGAPTRSVGASIIRR